jgi:hypothetical protein
MAVNVFEKNNGSRKAFINYVEEREKIEDQEILSREVVRLQKKLEGTGVSVEAYLGSDDKPIIELRY